ncbi:MAG TPA: branched-chain amino acid ABC transporter substrate-binding protein [Solirubrobacteraceae bacterium]|nr:branched-chain amino acid ABC transporter substrate-binding protein [Solirubrobacteraceae bacterium]
MTIRIPEEEVSGVKVRTITALIAAGAFIVGCGSSSSSSTTSSATTSAAASSGGASKSCAISIGMEGPLTGPVAVLGQEQLAFAQLAVKDDNAANGTNISLVQGDTQLNPAQATTVTQQFISNPKIVAVVGPAGSQEVLATGPLFGRAGLAFISGSATNTTLTNGKNPTFFRVVSRDDVQGPEDARYVVAHLKPKALMIVDDQEAYSTGLVSSMIPVFKSAGISVDHESVSQKVTDFSSLVAKVTPNTTVVVLPWQVAANGQQFGKNLAEQHKKAVIFGTDGLQSSSFTIPGSYVSAFGPDIKAIPADASIAAAAAQVYPKYGTFGPPVYAATHVIDQAIASVCKSGQTPTRANVLAAIKSTDEPTSILGQPIKFDAHGDLVGAKWFLFKINNQGKYVLVTNT